MSATGAPATRGDMIRGARFYDFVSAVVLLGQEPALRTMTVDLAAVQPGGLKAGFYPLATCNRHQA